MRRTVPPSYVRRARPVDTSRSSGCGTRVMVAAVVCAFVVSQGVPAFAGLLIFIGILLAP